MPIDLDAVHQRITRNYRGDEPAPPAPLRHVLKSKPRRLGQAPSPPACDDLPVCYDPYYYRFAMLGRSGYEPTQILSAKLTGLSNRRTSAYLGAVAGPGRLLSWTVATNYSGSVRSTHNIQVLASPTDPVIDSTDTAPLPGRFIIQSLRSHLNMPGAFFVLPTNSRPLPLHAALPSGTHYLYAWYAGATNGVLHYVLVYQPIVCGEAPPALELPEEVPSIPAGPDWPIVYTSTLSDYHRGLAYQWTTIGPNRLALRRYIYNPDLRFLPSRASALPPDTLVPPLPTVPPPLGGTTTVAFAQKVPISTLLAGS